MGSDELESREAGNQSGQPGEDDGALITRRGLVQGAGALLFLGGTGDLARRAELIPSFHELRTADPNEANTRYKEGGWRKIKRENEVSEAKIDTGIAAAGAIIFLASGIRRKKP